MLLSCLGCAAYFTKLHAHRALHCRNGRLRSLALPFVPLVLSQTAAPWCCSQAVSSARTRWRSPRLHTGCCSMRSTTRQDAAPLTSRPTQQPSVTRKPTASSDLARAQPPGCGLYACARSERRLLPIDPNFEFEAGTCELAAVLHLRRRPPTGGRRKARYRLFRRDVSHVTESQQCSL